jgi:hypothetical protein
MRDRRADLRADVAAFTVHGEVDDVWKLGGESMEVVLQDGRLRPPGPTRYRSVKSIMNRAPPPVDTSEK